MLPKFDQVASSCRLRSCLYAWHGSLPRSPSEDAACMSSTSLPEQGCLCKEETEIPMTPPSPYRERVVRGATLQSAVPFVTITALWLAARGVVGWPPPHCRKGFRHDSASGPRACFPSHRPTPGRVPHLERSTYALLGAPSLIHCSAVPRPL